MASLGESRTEFAVEVQLAAYPGGGPLASGWAGVADLSASEILQAIPKVFARLAPPKPVL